MNDNNEIQINENLLQATIKLNTILLSGMAGLASGLALLILTYIALAHDNPHAGFLLGLLSVFLPGYEITQAGAWIGFFWGAVIGVLLGAIVYRIYSKSIRQRVIAHINSGKAAKDIEYLRLRLDGNYLGMALGAMFSIGLIITTNWLVIRGTADESIHASLLAHYLPGYSVGFIGSIIGAVEIFIVIYFLSRLLSWIYNKIVDIRA